MSIKKTKSLLFFGFIVVLAILLFILLKPFQSSEKKTAEHTNRLSANNESQTASIERFIYKSANELATLIKQRKATSFEIISEFITHIKNNNHKYNSIIWLREQEALAEAKKADEAVAKGENLPLLLGVPVTVKEEFWLKGSPVTLNAKLNEKFIAPEDGPIVTQLKKAGAIILGKTNLPTLLMDFQVQGEIYPKGNNPYDTAYTPGGSTGGGAAALAAGFTSIEIGSDLGGSIRVPASFCGLYGLKTTWGTINITEGDGTNTNALKKRFALNTAGPLARTPEDLELAWQVLKGTKPDARFQQPIQWKQPSGKKLSGYKIAWMDEWKTNDGFIKVSQFVKEKIGQLTDSLKQKEASIIKYAPDTYDEMMKSYLTCLALLAGEDQPLEVRKSINAGMKVWDDGTGMLEPFYITMNNPNDAAWKAWQLQNNKLKAKWDLFFSKYDFFICPITYGPAFKKCEKGSLITEDGISISYFRYFPYATILNPIECPAITIPLGLNEKGLPIAVQVIGPRFSEPELLYFAKLIKPLVPGFIRPGK